MGQNCHICLWSGPRWLIPPPYGQPDRKISAFFFDDFPNDGWQIAYTFFKSYFPAHCHWNVQGRRCARLYIKSAPSFILSFPSGTNGISQNKRELKENSPVVLKLRWLCPLHRGNLVNFAMQQTSNLSFFVLRARNFTGFYFWSIMEHSAIYRSVGLESPSKVWFPNGWFSERACLFALHPSLLPRATAYRSFFLSDN